MARLLAICALPHRRRGPNGRIVVPIVNLHSSAPSSVPAAASAPVAAAVAGSTACPRCASVTQRVRRLWGDRLLSLFAPCVRCRCLSFTCSWEGRLRDPGRTSISLSERLWAPAEHRSTHLW